MEESRFRDRVAYSFMVRIVTFGQDGPTLAGLYAYLKASII
jgi:hypothetical protein